MQKKIFTIDVNNAKKNIYKKFFRIDVNNDAKKITIDVNNAKKNYTTMNFILVFYCIR